MPDGPRSDMQPANGGAPVGAGVPDGPRTPHPGTTASVGAGVPDGPLSIPHPGTTASVGAGVPDGPRTPHPGTTASVGAGVPDGPRIAYPVRPPPAAGTGRFRSAVTRVRDRQNGRLIAAPTADSSVFASSPGSAESSGQREGQAPPLQRAPRHVRLRRGGACPARKNGLPVRLYEVAQIVRESFAEDAVPYGGVRISGAARICGRGKPLPYGVVRNQHGTSRTPSPTAQTHVSAQPIPFRASHAGRGKPLPYGVGRNRSFPS